jgi:hypothetical protein
VANPSILIEVRVARREEKGGKREVRGRQQGGSKEGASSSGGSREGARRQQGEAGRQQGVGRRGDLVRSTDLKSKNSSLSVAIDNAVCSLANGVSCVPSGGFHKLRMRALITRWYKIGNSRK